MSGARRWVVSLGSRYLGTVTAGSEREARELGTGLLAHHSGSLTAELTVELTVDERGDA